MTNVCMHALLLRGLHISMRSSMYSLITLCSVLERLVSEIMKMTIC